MVIKKEPVPPEDWQFVDELKAPRHYSLRWGRTKKEKDEADLSPFAPGLVHVRSGKYGSIRGRISWIKEVE